MNVKFPDVGSSEYPPRPTVESSTEDIEYTDSEEIAGILKFSYFPSLWKIGYAVFIPKPGKPANEADSHQPLSLLNCIGKIIEHIIRRWIKVELHDKQYGFRRERSTEKCIRKVVDEIEAIQTR